MSGSSLRPHTVRRSLHSPTNSSSDHTTTPTSPHFSSHPNAPPVPRNHPHPYANRSVDLLASTSTLASTTRSPSHRAATPPLLHPPVGMPFAAYLESWKSEQVHQFLTLHKCGHYLDTFRRNDIDGRVLLDLDMASLKEMGVAKVGERVKLLSGIKDLRKRATGNVGMVGGMGRSVVELRLNGTATPSPDWMTAGGPGSASGTNGLTGGVGGLHGSVRNGHERSLSHAGSQSSMGDRRGMVDRSLSARRAGTSRPPPLDLQSSSRGHAPSLSYSHPAGNRSEVVPTSAVSAASVYDVPVSASTQRATTPRPTAQAGQQQQQCPGSLQRPSISSQTSSSATITPASLHSSTNSRSHTHPSNLNLRAPPPRDAGRRSPSPVNADPANFMDRPLPLPPAATAPSSSAAEYARQHAGTPTPMSSWQAGHAKGPSPSISERRTASSHGQPSASSLRDPASIRKAPAFSGAPISSTPQKTTSPVKSKFAALTGGSRIPQPAVHPFAATRDPKEISPPKERELSNRSGDNHSGTLRTQTGGYAVGAGPLKSGSTSSGSVPGPVPPRQNSTGSVSTTSAHMSLEDLRKQLVKFVNSEDGTTRTVNVSSCASGVEVLERVLKKFGKWNTGNVSTDTESDEEGERLEVDGWGVYKEDSDFTSKPLSEAALLGICLSHRDGSTYREKGLILRRSRKFGNRKNMTDFFGEQPPPPLSPTSPTYFGGPRLGITQAQSSDPSLLLTPTRSKRANNANTNRASMVSVMSGLGVAVADPPSPSTANRSPGSGSFLPGSRKKMYNFFGHRPPSELISNHLAEYFPSAKKKELDKTVRKSVYRQSIYGAKRGSIAPSVMSGRESFDFAPSAKPSPPRRRPTSRMTMTSPPSASAIPEEGEAGDEAGGTVERLQSGRPGVPRMSVSDDTGSIRRPTIDGDASASSGADSDRPPLLPAFEPFNESLSDSLQAYSRSSSGTAPPSLRSSPSRPKSIALQNRRNSASSVRSRMSTFSQLRRNRDKSDTASMLTVDEITAEVENRRASTISFDETSDEEDQEPAVVGTAILAPPQSISMTADVPVDEGQESGEADESDDESDEEDSSDDEDDDSDEDDDEDIAGEDEHGKAYTSTGSGRIIKWIKGALIGAGSFGSVYLGMDAQSGLLMAVKQVELGSGKNVERKRGMIEALEREIELLKELQHENIVQYLDSSIDGTHLNIFLEYVPGGSIAALLSNYGAFEEALVRNFVRQILTGLNYLHEREIIHRDIKGANILVDNKGGIKISDFGISKKVESNLLQGIGASRPSLQGSVFWMAPEIVKQTTYTSSADIWSVGCLVVEMLTGTHPWSDLTQMQALFRIGQAVCPAIPSDISPQAADLLKSTFEIDHTKRPTASDLLECGFLTARPKTVFISEAQAKASMAAVHAGAQRGMAMVGTKA